VGKGKAATQREHKKYWDKGGVSVALKSTAKKLD